MSYRSFLSCGIFLFVYFLSIHNNNFKIDVKQTRTKFLQTIDNIIKEDSEHENNRNVSKILIISQARSGSTFLGSIMSASLNSYYTLEPFMKTWLKGTLIADHIDKNNGKAKHFVQQHIKNLFNCLPVLPEKIKSKVSLMKPQLYL